MTAKQYEQAVATAIDNAVVGRGQIPTPAPAEHVLTTLATIVARLSRDYHLFNLRTLPDLAAEWGMDIRALQLRAQRRHERFGAGMMVSGTWLFAADEIELLHQDLRRSDTHKLE